MTYQRFLGRGAMVPFMMDPNGSTSYGTTLTINANGEKAAMIGRVWNKDSAAKTLTGVGFRLGSITKGGTTDVTVSLQDVSTTDGNPDGVQDQSVNIGNGNLVSNTWVEVTFGSSRSVAFGELLSVVWEYQTFNTGDSVVVNSLSTFNRIGRGDTYIDLYESSWTRNAAAGILVLIFDDGTYGCLSNSVPVKTQSSQSFSTSNDPESYGLAFQFPFACKIHGCAVQTDLDGDAELRLYDNNGNLVTNGTVVLDANTRYSTALGTWDIYFSQEHAIPANTEYRIMLAATTTTSIQLYYFDMDDADHRDCWLGRNCSYTQRSDAGAFTNTTTRVPMMALIISAIDDGAPTDVQITPGTTVTRL